MIFSFFSIASELSVADSLINRLELAETDNERVLLQIDLCNLYKNENSNIALEWAKKAYELAKRIDNKNGIELSLRAIRSIADVQKNYSDLYMSNNELEIIYRHRKDSQKIFECVERLLIYNRDQDSFALAKENMKELEQLNHHFNNDRIKEVFLNKGNLFWHMGNMDSAEYYYLNLHELSLEDKDDEKRRSALNNMGAIYFHREEYKSAKDVFLKALNIEHNKEQHMLELFNLSSAYYKLGMDDSSKYYDYKAIALAKKINRKISLERLYVLKKLFRKV